ncbi:MAG: methyltransferase domain-containing protein, partial [candidate division Zixibacteria bacterium]|nr:methyltransferase domain-containing protein [candidate division Zixibacteria bacterium]
MDIKKITGANRAAWNQATPVHQRARGDDLKTEFARPGYSTLDDTITALLTKLDLNGKRVAQVCCNNGRETISLVNMGAVSAVGFDISDAAIKEAQELASIANVDCRFVRTDAYDIGPEWNNQFDLIYISIGAISWMPNLDR